MHPVKDAGKCMGYAMYTHLFQDGVYVAIKFRVASMRYGRALKGRRVTLARARGGEAVVDISRLPPRPGLLGAHPAAT